MSAFFYSRLLTKATQLQARPLPRVRRTGIVAALFLIVLATASADPPFREFIAEEFDGVNFLEMTRRSREISAAIEAEGGDTAYMVSLYWGDPREMQMRSARGAAGFAVSGSPSESVPSGLSVRSVPEGEFVEFAEVGSAMVTGWRLFRRAKEFLDDNGVSPGTVVAYMEWLPVGDERDMHSAVIIQE